MTFEQAFAKVDLPRSLVAKLNGIETDLHIDKIAQRLSVLLKPQGTFDGSLAPTLQAELSARLPFARDVDVSVKYSAKYNAKECLEDDWAGILYEIGLSSPFCASKLRYAEWSLNDNVLNVTVETNASIPLKLWGMQKTLQRIINERYGLEIVVDFTESEQIQRPLSCPEPKRTDEPLLEPKPTITIPIEKKQAAPAPKKDTFQSDRPLKFKPRMKRARVKPHIDGLVSTMNEDIQDGEEMMFDGVVFRFETRGLKNDNNIMVFDMTDFTGSITCKLFTKTQHMPELAAVIKQGANLRVYGKITYDEFMDELVLTPFEVAPLKNFGVKRTDTAEKKRVELHLHTNMSAKDGIASFKQYYSMAAAWGHTAIALTDHGVAQAFPEAMKCREKGAVKPLYGVEAYIVDDLRTIPPEDLVAGRRIVVFDFETTGLDCNEHTVIEIGAVMMEDGKITGHFSRLINPGYPLPQEIVKLTGITDGELADKPFIADVLPEFLEFIDVATLCAHNAAFDMGFLKAEADRLGLSVANPYFCTLELSRDILPQLKNHKLNTLAKHLNVSLENHHRAVDDAEAAAGILLGLNAEQKKLLEPTADDYKLLPAYHAVIFARNKQGLFNLYKLISDSQTRYFHRSPRMLKSQIAALREGLIIGSACESGELFNAIVNRRSDADLERLAAFYDYLEIQPIANNMFLVRGGKAKDEEELRDFNRRVVALGEKLQKPVVATCDCHFLNPEDEIYRRIIMAGHGFRDTDHALPLYFRTTDEMLDEFSYLGDSKAFEVVVTNTNLIADMCEAIEPIPKGKFPPKIEGSEELLTEMTMARAHELYGDPLPPIVASRLERELDSIIKNGFAVMYVIAQKLVHRSEADGYLVGSRGSVGSSLVATMAGITEVNPLPPHYYCPHCHFTDFESEIVSGFKGASGCDMPARACPNCGVLLKKDGHDIPFETFLGFDGDKEPDIDLNFSGEYQSRAHAYTDELFGKEFVFKAGTISTLAEKTAFGFVKKYLNERNMPARLAEINRLVAGCTGVKRTTGQHPGGLVILPRGQEIYSFCPIQYPADDSSKDVTTTHFDYHSIEGRLLKLDILGHDVPTIIRLLHDFTGVDPRTVDLGDLDTLALFRSPEPIGLTTEQLGVQTGTLGLPEFGTSFVRQMLMDTKPQTFAELVRISGLSHGTDVWLNNAQDLVRNGVATLKEIIPTRDDIMVYLINKGVEKKASFVIMESVRRGRGLTPEHEQTLRDANVPEWYIESCKRIKYMFPKGHAVAYVMMTMRIGYFKIHYPAAFYAASFSVKSGEMDYRTMCSGREAAFAEMKRINSAGREASAKDKNALTILELCMEMYLRGLKFVPLDLYTADAKRFLVTEDGIMPPLCTVAGLGATVAQTIVEARANGAFKSIDDFRERTKVTKTVIGLLEREGILTGLDDQLQLSFF